jgi:hypothetical protein
VEDSLRTLVSVRAVAAARQLQRPHSPAALATRIIKNYRVTPAIALISDVLKDAIEKPNQRIVISTSPRTGKSVLAARIAVLLALARNPDAEVVLVSYADSLAQEHSHAARALISEHSELLGFRLSADKTAVGRWKVEGRKGGLLAAGILSGITGFGADCVAPDTRITTEHGLVTAERAYHENHSRIWSYDHATGMAGWHRVEAHRRIDGRELVTVHTQAGRVLRCTSDHRVYTRRGYIAAGELRASDAILSLDGIGGMSPLRGRISDHGAGATQRRSAQPEHALLLAGMPGRSVGRQSTRPDARGLRGVRVLSPRISTHERCSALLQYAMRLRRSPRAATKAHVGANSGMSDVSRRVPAEIVAHHVLRPRVRGLSAFAADDRQGQLEIQDGHQLRELVSADAANDPATRQASVRGVRPIPGTADVCESRQDSDQVAADDPSHQRAASGQPATESDHHVPVMPYHAPQVSYDTISSVTRDRGGTYSVYDFQVAGARNFFAEGLLVHNCLIIDDPVKNAQEADSTAHQHRILNEFRSTLMTRLHPKASVCVIGTRWSEADLIGTLLADEPGRWTHINIPAVAEVGIPDALERAPGIAMTSALGRTAEEFEDIKRSVGSRAWYALFQGVPSSPEGGLIKRDWLDSHRLSAAPTRPVLTVVGVDPSDSGSGDACGIVACSLTPEGISAVIADVSAPMTSDAWAKAAIDLALEVGASEIAVESFAARETYQRVVRDALARVKTDRRITVTAWPPKGSGRGGGDAVARSSALLQALEVGTCRLAGHFPRLEEAAVTWQSGQHQPDGVAALVVAHDVLVHSAGVQWQVAAPMTGSLTGSRAPTPDAPVTSMEDYLRRRVG